MKKNHGFLRSLFAMHIFYCALIGVFFVSNVFADCFNGVIATTPTEPVSNLPTCDEMIDNGTITGSGTSWQPVNLDAYIDGQEWSVQFNDGIIYGYSACTSPNWTLAESPYSANKIVSANAGCICSLDKQNWYFIKKFTVGDTRGEKTDYCRANCPVECAQRFANNTNNLRTIILEKYGSCPNTITYNNNNGDGCINTLYYGSQKLCEPNRNGYTFNEWYDETNDISYNANDVVSDVDISLVAQWNEKNIIYTFVCDRNQANYVSPDVYANLTSIGIIFPDNTDMQNCPESSSYDVNGWVCVSQDNPSQQVEFENVSSASWNYDFYEFYCYPKWLAHGCSDCFCNKTGNPSPTSAVSGLPTWNEMLSSGIISGSGSSYKPANGRFDDYIDGQEWSVIFNNSGIVNGFSVCGPTSWTASASPYYEITSANSGCLCSLDKQSWWYTKNLDGGVSGRGEKTDYCRANCPAECAKRFSNNTNTLRSRMTAAYGSCPAKVNVNWFSNGTLINVNTCVIDDMVEFPQQTPTRIGYNFAGWEITPND